MRDRRESATQTTRAAVLPSNDVSGPGWVKLALVLLALVSTLPSAALAQECDGLVAPVDTPLVRGVEAISIPGQTVMQITAMPGDPDRVFVVLLNGTIRYWQRGTPTDLTRVFLDIEIDVRIGNELGFQGIAWAPDFETTGHFYVSYNSEPSGDTVIERYTAIPNPTFSDAVIADLFSDVEILRLGQPQSNHNGGQIRFDSSGALLLSLGDGGGSGDGFGSCGNGQNEGTLLGSIIRIDPTSSGGTPAECANFGNYTVPVDNPLADGAGGTCDEIFAYGLRNPYRFDIDPQTGDLVIGDVGQAVLGGDRLHPRRQRAAARTSAGARWKAGTASTPSTSSTARRCRRSAPARRAATTRRCSAPAGVYPHEDGDCSIIGGVVYRGCRLPQFDGEYFYGDYCSSKIEAATIQSGRVIRTTDWTTAVDSGDDLFLQTGWGRDFFGEMYVGDRNGLVLKIVPPFAATEVSGTGGTPFQPSDDGPWSWEDVLYETSVPVTQYRVYRGTPGQTLSCIYSGNDAVWSGDPFNPAAGQVWGYVVTAVDEAADETAAGGTNRVLAGPCP